MAYRNIGITEGVLRIFSAKEPGGLRILFEVQDWKRFEELLGGARDGNPVIFEDNSIDGYRVTIKNCNGGIKHMEDKDV